jgi:YhcH/YjgK/YiaL family protein
LIIPENYMNANWEKAIAWLRGENWKTMPLGKIEIGGTRVYATRSSSKTKLPEAARYETHWLYADIQMLIAGTEIIEVCRPELLTGAAPYNPEKDIEFYAGTPAPVHQVVLSAPLAAVFFPEDAHKPSIAVGKPATVNKVVVKVALN